MTSYSFAHLANQRLLREYDAIESRENADTALALALLGELDARKLYLPAGYPSMYAYCLQARHMSEDRACKRIRVARAAREFPVIYDAISAGRVHLTGLFLLAPLMTAKTVDGLLAAATHKTKNQIELLIAELAPKQDLPEYVEPIEAPSRGDFFATPTERSNLGPSAAGEAPPALGRVGTIESAEPSRSRVPLPEPRPKVAPLSAQRFGVQFTMDQATHDLLREVQALLGAGGPSGDITTVFALALQCLKTKLEKQKLGKTEHPGKRRGSTNPRYIPAEVRRAVSQRDDGQCAFVGDQGHRCEARGALELDHITPVARGGESTVDNVRLCCRAHNQFAAERVLGSAFMKHKREAVHAGSKPTRARGLSRDLVPRLRELGLTAEQAAKAAARCANYRGMPIEDRLALALRDIAPSLGPTGAHANCDPA